MSWIWKNKKTTSREQKWTFLSRGAGISKGETARRGREQGHEGNRDRPAATGAGMMAAKQAKKDFCEFTQGLKYAPEFRFYPESSVKMQSFEKFLKRKGT